MKRIILGISLSLASYASMAQINVFSGNTVGIGSGLASSASTLNINTIGATYATMSLLPMNTSVSRGILTLNNPNTIQNFIGLGSVLSSSTSGNGSVLRAIWGQAQNSTVQLSTKTFGVMGTAGNGMQNYNCGVWGNLNGTSYGAGVYGSVNLSDAPTDGAQYAGYFAGNVKITGTIWAQSGTITGSDQKLKKNIALLDSSDRIFQLQPKKYNLKSRSELIASAAISVSKSDTGVVATAKVEDAPDYTKKQHYGFLAQDLQKVFPELVYTAGDGTLGVDYQGLIPIIIAQLQTMKQQMDAKDARILALEQAIQKLKK